MRTVPDISGVKFVSHAAQYLPTLSVPPPFTLS